MRNWLLAGSLAIFSTGTYACPLPPDPPQPVPAATPRTAFWSKTLAFFAYPGSRMMTATESPASVSFADLDHPELPPGHYAGICDMSLTKSSPQTVLAYYQKLLPGAEMSGGLWQQSLYYGHGWADSGPTRVGTWNLSVSCGEKEYTDGKWTQVTLAVHVGLDNPSQAQKFAPPTKQMHSVLTQLQLQLMPARHSANR